MNCKSYFQKELNLGMQNYWFWLVFCRRFQFPIPRIPPQSFQDFINKNKKIPLKMQCGTDNLLKIPKMRSVKSTLKLIMCKLKLRRYTREISSKFAIKIKKKIINYQLMACATNKRYCNTFHGHFIVNNILNIMIIRICIYCTFLVCASLFQEAKKGT